MTRGFRRSFKPLEIVTEEEVDAIHQGTLEVLWKTGVLVDHDRALNVFRDNGCKVDFEKKRARIPTNIVEDCLHKAPSVFGVKARKPKDDIIIGGNTGYFTNFPGMQTVNWETWEPRPATREEYYDYVKILLWLIYAANQMIVKYLLLRWLSQSKGLRHWPRVTQHPLCHFPAK